MLSLSDWAKLLLEQAQLMEGETLEDPAGFVQRMNTMLVDSMHAKRQLILLTIYKLNSCTPLLRSREGGNFYLRVNKKDPLFIEYGSTGKESSWSFYNSSSNLISGIQFFPKAY